MEGRRRVVLAPRDVETWRPWMDCLSTHRLHGNTVGAPLPSVKRGLHVSKQQSSSQMSRRVQCRASGKPGEVRDWCLCRGSGHACAFTRIRDWETAHLWRYDTGHGMLEVTAPPTVFTYG